MPRSILRAVALPALVIALCGAYAALSAYNRKAATDTGEMLAKARQEAQAIQARLAALPLQCTVGDAGGPAGQWIDSRNGACEPGQPYTYVFTFKAPVHSAAFRVALNAKALKNLEKVEARDAGGTWAAAWTGAPAGAPAGCEFVKMAQRFEAGARDVAALRITVRPDTDKVVVADPGLLQAD
jgi:hypothetical protein